MSLDITKGLRYTAHARDQMEDRLVNEVQVEQALIEYHTSYPAELLPNDPIGATVYVADIDGRTLKVYVENNSEPPLVRTVAWRDR
ncbi:MAG: DUF4258 domain-containing protein [Dehalococcoidia bacterium]